MGGGGGSARAAGGIAFAASPHLASTAPSTHARGDTPVAADARSAVVGAGSSALGVPGNAAPGHASADLFRFGGEPAAEQQQLQPQPQAEPEPEPHQFPTSMEGCNPMRPFQLAVVPVLPAGPLPLSAGRLATRLRDAWPLALPSLRCLPERPQWHSPLSAAFFYRLWQLQHHQTEMVQKALRAIAAAAAAAEGAAAASGLTGRGGTPANLALSARMRAESNGSVASAVSATSWQLHSPPGLTDAGSVGFPLSRSGSWNSVPRTGAPFAAAAAAAAAAVPGPAAVAWAPVAPEVRVSLRPASQGAAAGGTSMSAGDEGAYSSSNNNSGGGGSGGGQQWTAPARAPRSRTRARTSNGGEVVVPPLRLPGLSSAPAELPGGAFEPSGGFCGAAPAQQLQPQRGSVPSWPPIRGSGGGDTGSHRSGGLASPGGLPPTALLSPVMLQSPTSTFSPGAGFLQASPAAAAFAIAAGSCSSRSSHDSSARLGVYAATAAAAAAACFQAGPAPSSTTTAAAAAAAAGLFDAHRTAEIDDDDLRDSQVAALKRALLAAAEELRTLVARFPEHSAAACPEACDAASQLELLCANQAEAASAKASRRPAGGDALSALGGVGAAWLA